ncbi:CDP-glycerol glycerophosphotransferase family protein [Planktomarina sp.]|nr:CDP-glycerol glycerophosphotransferase family protein [Planktomarina sp.]
MDRYKITLFITDNCERQALEPIAEEASARGIPVRFSDDANEPADIGFYCAHLARPNARLSFIMLHDMAQAHNVWPNFWMQEPWNAFDFGILPGPLWSGMWEKSKHMRYAQPKFGMYELGWPKADLIYKDISSHQAEVNAFRKKLNLKYYHTVTYAPSWENHGKQSDFVRSLLELPVNLLLKQAPWSKAYPWVLENIQRENSLHQNISDKVKIIDPEISIMRVLGLTDLLVSDESSVLYEACLADVPSLAVDDWPIPDTNPPRLPSIPLNEIARTPLSGLSSTVLKMLQNSEAEKQKCAKIKDLLYSNLGSSSLKIINFLDEIHNNNVIYQPLK